MWGNRSSATPLAPLMAPLPPLMAPLASSVTPLAYTVTPLPYFKKCERPSLVPKSSDDFKKTPKDFCYKLKYQKGYCTRAYQEELDQQVKQFVAHFFVVLISGFYSCLLY